MAAKGKVDGVAAALAEREGVPGEGAGAIGAATAVVVERRIAATPHKTVETRPCAPRTRNVELDALNCVVFMGLAPREITDSRWQGA